MRLAWIVQYVPDVQATVDFYEKAFGLTVRFASGADFAAMETGGTVLSFAREGFVAPQGIPFRPTRPDGPPPAQEIAFEVGDVAAAHARAVAAGAVEIAAPQLKPWGQSVSYLRDPNGALVEICSPIPTLA
jgi:catechol 2,3-dioxygenase-like lactoylglutathione lyase family enzyme